MKFSRRVGGWGSLSHVHKCGNYGWGDMSSLQKWKSREVRDPSLIVLGGRRGFRKVFVSKLTSPPPPPGKKKINNNNYIWKLYPCPSPFKTESLLPSVGIDLISYKIPVVSSLVWDFEGARREKVSTPKAPHTWGSLGAYSPRNFLI